MVAIAQRDDSFDGSFDAFAEPANLILSNIIEMLPARFSGRAELLRKAGALKLPGNPLVGLAPNVVCCHNDHACW